MSKAVVDFVIRCKMETKIDKILKGQAHISKEIKKGLYTEGEQLVSLKAQLNELSEKSNKKPTWADIVSRRPPVYNATNPPTRAKSYYGGKTKYPEILVKTNETEALVNRQKGDMKLEEVVNH